MSAISALQAARAAYQPKLPTVFANGAAVNIIEGDATTAAADLDQIQALFPETYGAPKVNFEANMNKTTTAINVAVILSGGQAPGGHNVIAGIFDGIISLNADSKLYGFLGGPGGAVDNKYMEIDSAIMDAYRNTGGFDIIGSGRTKLEETAQFDQVITNCKALNIGALVIIGGDDSNTNGCVLAEYCKAQNSGILVIGAPKTIDGDLKNEDIEASFGFDTACKVYSELIGNISRDACSARKYWHFIKVMGRSASHIALECGLQTRANVTLVSEEVEAKAMTLGGIVADIADKAVKRAAKGEHFGIVVIPEGVIEFIPQMKVLIAELNDLLAHDASLSDSLPIAADVDQLQSHGLSAESASVYLSMPANIRQQLVMDRDPHGNVQVSRIETEKLIASMVEMYMEENHADIHFSEQHHFFGYEGRCAAPSNFDADYCYSLGYTAAALIGAGKTACLASVKNLKSPASEWVAGGIPLTSMMNVERRHGADKPVIKKALVELDGAPFKELVANRDEWALHSNYVFPGPIQYFGPTEVCDQPTITLTLEQR
ncbi:diphosphate--fructose-6-phosphate 1-phosphotransferase [Lentisphaera araneosa HTCC2155]|uniref:Pyrophosphate--fructose 6-phosphate 1-phosphotransferase n=1 Tax=Lentisphaera araneosa HTCC2155 TaxID=313628 RepID=A6DIS9_9BACT|nr:diphosphate--fructose-6-phosphate 1-phosphotransferase [Lentisphaera araneosa]EDM28365.1 diphosphate--fructose-6-phosphate 1-phosphotransferase [Lentisphaera araneosa HTCC2155]